MFLAVLEDKDTIVGQQSALEDKGRDCWEFFQGVRWVGKDKIELLLTGFYEAEDVATECSDLIPHSTFHIPRT